METRSEVSAGGVVYRRTEDGVEMALAARRTRRGELVWGLAKGAIEPEESDEEAAVREVREETGLEAHGLRDAHVQRSYPILPAWRSRYAPGVERNLEHLMYLEVPEMGPVQLEPTEHVAYLWMPIECAIEKVASWTNREALQRLKDSRRA